MKNDCYFTVDFEDFTFDLSRSLGIKKRPKYRYEQLHEAYNNINTLLNECQTNKSITFFCTAVIAKDYPDLLEQISSDGHEIACHGNFHDDSNKFTPNQLKKELVKAKEILEKVSNQHVRGFRAPRFSINHNNSEHIKVINEVFDYDSSLHFSTKKELESWRNNNNKILEFPVPIQKSFKIFKFKTGGSYFKLFPINFVVDAAEKSIKNGLDPIFYFHPYDLYDKYDLRLKFYEMHDININKKLYYMLRQAQWVGAFNWSVLRKLEFLINNFNNIGRLDSRINAIKC